MNPNILIVEDDSNTSEAIRDFLQGSVSENKFRVHAVRTVDGAETWMNDKSRSCDLQVCILDLMFPPKVGEIAGDFTDFTQGLRFYNTYLRGKYKTLVLTGALRFNLAAEAVKAAFEGDPDAKVVPKPIDMERLEEMIKELLR